MAKADLEDVQYVVLCLTYYALLVAGDVSHVLLHYPTARVQSVAFKLLCGKKKIRCSIVLTAITPHAQSAANQTTFHASAPRAETS